MNTILEKATETRAAVKEFKDTLALFYRGSSLPYATRAPLDSLIFPVNDKNAEVVYESNRLQISVSENRIICGFGVSCTHKAVITLQNFEDVKKTAEWIESYFHEADRKLISGSISNINYIPVCEFIAQTADYCGCLTDINLPDENEMMLSGYRRESIGKSFSAVVALLAICLIFRRLAALRGFNFKLIFNDGLPALAFSAKILGEGIESIKDLPEYPALEDLDSSGGITLYSRLVKLTPEDGEELQRLTMVMTLLDEDPSGILRAPEWKAKQRASLDDVDLDIPGRF
ncbi:MAG: hypothetical protein J6S71_08685 [Clostridia bacterium]|nr:hypothetical protein [Clostridia bacterium]